MFLHIRDEPKRPTVTRVAFIYRPCLRYSAQKVIFHCAGSQHPTLRANLKLHTAAIRENGR